MPSARSSGGSAATTAPSRCSSGASRSAARRSGLTSLEVAESLEHLGRLKRGPFRAHRLRIAAAPRPGDPAGTPGRPPGDREDARRAGRAAGRRRGSRSRPRRSTGRRCRSPCGRRERWGRRWPRACSSSRRAKLAQGNDMAAERLARQGLVVERRVLGSARSPALPRADGRRRGPDRGRQVPGRRRSAAASLAEGAAGAPRPGASGRRRHAGQPGDGAVSPAALG